MYRMSTFCFWFTIDYTKFAMVDLTSNSMCEIGAESTFRGLYQVLHWRARKLVFVPIVVSHSMDVYVDDQPSERQGSVHVHHIVMFDLNGKVDSMIHLESADLAKQALVWRNLLWLLDRNNRLWVYTKERDCNRPVRVHLESVHEPISFMAAGNDWFALQLDTVPARILLYKTAHIMALATHMGWLNAQPESTRETRENNCWLSLDDTCPNSIVCAIDECLVELLPTRTRITLLSASSALQEASSSSPSWVTFSVPHSHRHEQTKILGMLDRPVIFHLSANSAPSTPSHVSASTCAQIRAPLIPIRPQELFFMKSINERVAYRSHALTFAIDWAARTTRIVSSGAFSLLIRLTWNSSSAGFMMEQFKHLLPLSEPLRRLIGSYIVF